MLNVTCSKTFPGEEFEWQGCRFGGPCAKFSLAGNKGKHPQNIKRDFLRRIDQTDPDQKVTWLES